MSNTICIYHGNCADGFGAAWAVWKRFPDWEFHAGVYQNAPPDVTDKHVVMVDFSYKRPVLEEMRQSARSMLILDHHKTAADDLAGLISPSSWRAHLDNVAQDSMENADINGVILYAQFDMERSGAMIAWDFFHPDTEPPQLLRHIEDRDLWRFQLEGTREIQANLFSYPYDFETWDRLMGTPVSDLHSDGAAIERKHFKDIDELIKVVTRPMLIGGHVVPVANLPYTLTSDAGHKLATGKPFAACYWDTPDGRVFSLRSTDDGEDVSAIAKQYGGGGHRNASGFRVPFDQLDQFEPVP